MRVEPITFEQSDIWERALADAGRRDVYYEHAYLSALRERDEGEPVLLRFDDGGRTAIHVTMRRPIPTECADLRRRCDWASPYGYAGPLSGDENLDGKRMAAAWRGAARDCGVVSEFVRFHPVLRTHAPFALVDGVEPRSETVIWDLRGDVAAGLSPTCAKNLRWAEKKGVAVEFEDGTAWPRFRTLYRDTMKRRGARDYYDFDDSYFKTLCAGLGSDLRFAFAVHEGRDAAAAMILRSGERAHYHLGASDHALRSLCATNALLVAVARRARDEGATVFHLGGGLSSGDSLFEFKAGFSVGRGRFHVGRFIDDSGAYGQLVEERRERGPLDESFFPAYRAPLSDQEP